MPRYGPRMSAEEQQALQGVQFASIEGRRSSTTAAKTVFSDAVAAVDVELARRISAAKDWRKRYMGPVRDVVVAGISSPKNALRIAADGLDSLHRNLTFVTDDGELSLRSAVGSRGDHGILTREIAGEGTRPDDFTIPYQGQELRGDGLHAQLERWQSEGIIHASCAAAVADAARTPEWLDLRDLTFVLLGAASQMGPLEHLLAWGAHVIAVDLPRPHIWTHILEYNRRGSGQLTVPFRTVSSDDVVASAGLDLTTELPEVAAWLGGIEDPFIIGNYIYADGATFVRLAGGVDALIAHLLEGGQDRSLAYLATPTDIYAVPSDVVAAARSHRKGGLGRSVARAVARGNLYQPNYTATFAAEDGGQWGISDCLVPIQGPNYALAKSLQRWRAVSAREDGHLTSANVAPATRTASVVKNKMLAAAYRGAAPFGVEIFEPETSRALTFAMLVHDLRAPAASARPDSPLDHPYRLFTEGAAHGGIWNLGHEPRTVLPLALLRGAIARS